MATKPAGSERRRNTKNSLRVTAFENQNQIIKQVLEASKKMDNCSGTKSSPKGKEENVDNASKNSGQDALNRESVGANSGEFVKSFSSEATQTAWDCPPEKKRKIEVKDSYILNRPRNFGEVNRFCHIRVMMI